MNQPETTHVPATRDEAIAAMLAAGYTQSQAEVLVGVDELCMGRDANETLPLLLLSITNTTTNLFSPEGMRLVARMLSEAAFALSATATEVEDLERRQQEAENNAGIIVPGNKIVIPNPGGITH